ncbi:hypothetical protein K466DRAFT_569664, partial [Polyporus arcularius HHB13444]
MDVLDSPASPPSSIPPLGPQAQDTQPLEAETDDVIMMNPPPSPPPPVAGAKREMVGVRAFALENVKAARVNDTVRIIVFTATTSRHSPEVLHSRTCDPSLGMRRTRILPLHPSSQPQGVVIRPPGQTFQFSLPQAAPQQF